MVLTPGSAAATAYDQAHLASALGFPLVQGSDLVVLRGAEGLLARQAIAAVQFEYNWRWIEGRLFLRDAFSLFQAHGYSLGKVTPRGIEPYRQWEPDLETLWEGNYLALAPGMQAAVPIIPWWNGS